MPIKVWPFRLTCFVSVLDQLVSAQHGVFAIKMVRGWNFWVNVQGTSLREVSSTVRVNR